MGPMYQATVRSPSKGLLVPPATPKKRASDGRNRAGKPREQGRKVLGDCEADRRACSSDKSNEHTREKTCNELAAALDFGIAQDCGGEEPVAGAADASLPNNS